MDSSMSYQNMNYHISNPFDLKVLRIDLFKYWIKTKDFYRNQLFL